MSHRTFNHFHSPNILFIYYSFTVSQQENTLYDDSEKTQSSPLILITHIISNTLTLLLMNTTNVHLSHFGVNIKALY